MAKFFAKFSRNIKLAIISIIVVVIAVPLTIFGAGAFGKGGGNTVEAITLSQTKVNRVFVSENTQFALPDVIIDRENYQDYTVEWSDGESSHERVAFLRDNHFYSILPIDVSLNTERATTSFIATVTGPNEIKTLTYTVTVIDLGSDYFSVLSSTQRGHVDYETRGIAQTRVFGLYDIVMPSSGVITPENFEQVQFANSSNAFDLRWNYRGNPDIEVWVEDMKGNRLRQDWVDYDKEVNNRKITVNFLEAKSVKLVAQSIHESRPGFRPRYEYVYNIEDAVNVYDFAQVKLMEKLARYTYITQGVRLYDENGQFAGYQKRADGTEITEKNLSNFIRQGSDANGLLSQHFAVSPKQDFPTQVPGANVVWDGWDDKGAYLLEFSQWAPSFRYKDIVIRSTNKNPALSTYKMETWAESTWFFGSVFGNGYQLDATPYTRPADGQGRYRNVHSMRGQNGQSLGFEGKRFFPGYGWGDIFAFYALANNSTIDNLTLTGENIPQGSVAIKLNRYSSIGVIGTSHLTGNSFDFSFGRSHNEQGMVRGLFPESITIQNSIIEKGLTLVGGAFAADAEKPIVIDTNVFRFGGFTGILGTSFGGGIGEDDFEGGVQVSQKNQFAFRDGQLLQRDGLRYGNFIIARDNIFHDISVSPVLTMPSRSGSHISIEGNENYFFTWLRSNDIQFPEMKNPSNEGFARIEGGSINGQIPVLLNKIFNNTDPAHRWQVAKAARYEQENGIFLINVPAINVTDEGKTPTSTITMENSFLSQASQGKAIINAYAWVSDGPAGGNVPAGLDQRFDLLLLAAPDRPEAASISSRLIKVTEMNTSSINMRIANMVPAGVSIARVVSTTIELDGSDDGSITLLRGGNASLAGHRIEFNGKAIPTTPGVFNELTTSFTISKAGLIQAGIKNFGQYTLNLVSTQTANRGQIASKFNLLLQGSTGNIPSVVPGSAGYQTKYIEYEFVLPQDDSVVNVTLLPHTQISFTFNNGVLRFDGTELRHGANTLQVRTNGLIFIIKQDVLRHTMGVEAMPIDLSQVNPSFIINLAQNTNLSELNISIDGQTLAPNQFLIDNNRIIVTNSVIESILESELTAGTRVSVGITNENGLLLNTWLVFIDSDTHFTFGANAISTLQNMSNDINTPFINIAAGHRHFTDVTIELQNHQGENIFGISLADTDDEFVAKSTMIRYDENLGFKTEYFANGRTLLTIPAAVIAEGAYQSEHRIWVFSGINSARTTDFLRIFDANHVDAPIFLQDEFAVGSNENATIGFVNGIYLYDLFPAEFSGIPLEWLLGDSKDFSLSTFDSNGATLTIRDASGQIIKEFTLDEIFSGSSDVEFIFSYGGPRNEPREIALTTGLVHELLDLVSDLIPEDIKSMTIEEVVNSIIDMMADFDLDNLLESLLDLIPEEFLDMFEDFDILAMLEGIDLEEILPLIPEEYMDIITEIMDIILNANFDDISSLIPEQYLEMTVGEIIDMVFDMIRDLVDNDPLGMIEDGKIVIPAEIADMIPVIPALDAFYVEGFTLSQQLIQTLGTGTFLIEVRNNYNIAFTTIAIG